MPILFTPKRKTYKNACLGVKCYFFHFVRFGRTFSLSVKSMGIPSYFSLNLKSTPNQAKRGKAGFSRKTSIFAFSAFRGEK